MPCGLENTSHMKAKLQTANRKLQTNRKKKMANTTKTNSGITKFFKTENGYGFIKDDESGKDIFVHATGCIDKIKENDAVSFNVVEGKRGASAVDVTIL